jgi:hypothetical protein
MEKMETEREAQDLKAVEEDPHARSVRSMTMSKEIVRRKQWCSTT